MELDEELNLVQEFYYDVPNIYNSLLIQDAFFDANGIVILRGNLDDPAPGDENDIYLAKINTNGELLDTTIITDLNNDSGAEILKRQDGSGYYILGTGIHKKIVLDNDLNVIEYQDFPAGSVFSSPLALRWLPDGNIMVANMANQSVPGAYYDIRLRIVDESFNTIKDTTFFDEGKNRLAYYSSLDYVDPDNIWVVTYINGWKSSIDEWESARVYIVDSEMNLKGAKYFAGDLDVYLYSTKALEDGGCIITGLVPKDGKNYDWNVYVRKLMLDDIFTNAEETPAPDDSDVLLFPNPVKDVLHIETYRKNLSVSLYDESGKCVTERRELHIPKTQFNISHLPGGIYFYLVFDKEKVIKTGKIIKQNINQ
ncbi:MAG: T9SS type A sorting domain-containing protein [Chlorobi bacterium]|nr:T9SS type A sorting domain-containing protein [Chlorobiota bacterium]